MCYNEQIEKTKHEDPISTTLQRQTETHRTNTPPSPGADAPSAGEVEAQRQLQDNVTLTREIRQELPPAQAVRTAPGIPIQAQKPAKRSFKERRRDARKARAARRAGCPVGSATSYDMVTALQESIADRNNAQEPHKDLIEKSKVDNRVLFAFTRGYKVKGRNKTPATPQDAENKLRDDKFYEDYCSNDIKRRRPHLEEMVNELISHEYSPEMFTEQYLRGHAREMGELAGRMLCMDNVMQDPINAPFFRTLDPYRAQALNESFKLFVKYHGAMIQIMAKFGVNFNKNKYYEKKEAPVIEIGEALAETCKQQFDEAISVHEQTMNRLKEEQKTRVEDSAKSYAQRMEAGIALLARLKEDPRLGLRKGEENSQFFSRSHVFLQIGDEFYEQNLEKMKMFLEVNRLGKGGKPSEELYNRVRDLASPRLERIMHCDVDELAELSDEDLMVRTAELNELFMDNMFLADLLKLRHHSLDVVNEGREATVQNPTLRDELMKYRSEEYSYKQMMLRALQERARALAIRQALKDGSQESMFTKMEERNDDRTADPESWCEHRLDISRRLIETARETRAEKLTPGTQAFQVTIRERETRIKISNQIRNAGNPLLRALDEVWEGDTEEAKQIRARVRGRHYYSLQYSEAELRERGLNQNNIGESLFRSLTSFFGLEAAEKLLTPEKALAMYKDLGTGAGMHKGKWTEDCIENGKRLRREAEGTPEEELKPAAEQNARGVAAFREVIRAQYDMITRKYGNAIESMPLEVMVQNKAQIHRDFMENQVAMNMCNKYPDFLNPDDPEDQLLFHRLQYYTLVGTVLDGVVDYIASYGFEGEEQVREALKMYMATAQQPFVRESESWLLEHDPAFKHGIEWGQGVNVPGENAGA
ncbi:MAG: hypothetical protein LIO67_10070 [Lachnospiraceae bacterium]|nr:hypothetical protein [Lachnospiraceae bacterium]